MKSLILILRLFVINDIVVVMGNVMVVAFTMAIVMFRWPIIFSAMKMPKSTSADFNRQLISVQGTTTKSGNFSQNFLRKRIWKNFDMLLPFMYSA